MISIALTDNDARLTPEYLANLSSVVNAEENPVIYLGIDPGKANGVCGYDAKYYVMFMLTIQADDMNMFINQFTKVKTCIIEDYRIFPGKEKQHIYSSLETPRVIGRVEAWAETNKIELVKQGAHIKETGYKWIGAKPLPKSNKNNHKLDAHVHFMYWAVKSRLINAAELLKRPSR